MSCELARLDGAYVLGALAPDERLAFERHLGGCASCSASVRDLAGLPGLLAQVKAEDVEADPVTEPLPPTLLPALVREVRREQHRRRWTFGLVAAAALVAVGLGTAAVVNAVDGGSGGAPQAAPSLAAAQEMTPVDQHDVLGDISMTPVAWGTRLDLTCSYEEPTSAYQDERHSYALVVHTRDGGTEQVATWNGVPGRTMHLTGATALPTDEISSVEVRSASGDPVLELNG